MPINVTNDEKKFVYGKCETVYANSKSLKRHKRNKNAEAKVIFNIGFLKIIDVIYKILPLSDFLHWACNNIKLDPFHLTPKIKSQGASYLFKTKIRVSLYLLLLCRTPGEVGPPATSG